MKIIKILSTYGNDFIADVQCEHCNHKARLTSGYNDDYYYNRVLPAMLCISCGKNRAGETGHTDNGVSPCSI